jgi:class 3 adenylate cyclase/tetratricopeptide (TPR) repeat protein
MLEFSDTVATEENTFVRTCAACGTGGQPDGHGFCFACGGALEAPLCASCGSALSSSARFCGVCGAAQASDPQPTSVMPTSARRVTSVLFADLVGFTSLSESRDQEDVRELLTRYFRECEQVVARYGGVVEKFIGDAVMAVWGVPTAHEDDAQRSVRAGLELVSVVAAIGAEVAVPGLALRCGIVTGEVAVTIGATNQGMVAGDAVNTASRVQSVAAPGQVWVDETTKLLTSSAISYADAGSHLLKGKADPIALWSARAVVAEIGGAHRNDGLEAPLVGRVHDLRLVKDLFHRVEQSQRAAMLIVSGEAGVGKTRLGWEFDTYTDGLSTIVRWHAGRCISYGEGVAFYALAEAIRGRLQLLVAETDHGEEPDGAAMLALGLDAYVVDQAEREWLAPRLGALLGVGTAGTFRREDLFEAWTTFLHRISDGGADGPAAPVVLMLDDGHHADEGLIAFLEHLLMTADFACFVAVFARPELVRDNPTLATNRRVTALHLDSLSDADMGDLLDGLVAALPPSVRDSLVMRADGIPLYAVETVRSLIDRDLVVPRGGRYVLADPSALDLDSVAAPASLQALIAARLDALSVPQRRVVDRGCILGQTFSRESLEALCTDVTDLDDVVSELVRLQILRVEDSRFSNERGHLVFVQSAVRQVAYSTLSRRDRKAAHVQVARYLALGEDGAGAIAPVIAQHYLDAVDAVPEDPDVTELTRLAIEQLRRAADRAAALSAPGEAANHLTTALERATEEQEVADIELALSRHLSAAGRYEEAITHASAAVEAYAHSDDQVAKASAAFALADALATGRGEHEQAISLVGPQLEALTGRLDVFPLLGRLSAQLVRSRMLLGLDFRDAADEAVRLATRSGEPGLIADSYISLALHYFFNGASGLGRVLLQSAEPLAREAHDSRTLSRILQNLQAYGNFEDAQASNDLGDRSMATARLSGDSAYITNAATNHAISAWLVGQWDEALSLLSEVQPSSGDEPWFDVIRGLILLARGETWAPSHQLDGSFDDLQIRAMTENLESMLLREQSDPTAVQRGLDAVASAYGQAGLSDDFPLVWHEAATTALHFDDLDSLGVLIRRIDDDPSGPPCGLRGHRERFGALRAERLGSDPADVEAALRVALIEYEAWRAPVFVALGRRELGLFLQRQGRADEAEVELGSSRAIFTQLGAAAWLRDLDSAEAGLPA